MRGGGVRTGAVVGEGVESGISVVWAVPKKKKVMFSSQIV